MKYEHSKVHCVSLQMFFTEYVCPFVNTCSALPMLNIKTPYFVYIGTHDLKLELYMPVCLTKRYSFWWK